MFYKKKKRKNVIILKYLENYFIRPYSIQDQRKPLDKWKLAPICITKLTKYFHYVRSILTAITRNSEQQM